jgi:hypothetical protein
VHRILAKLAELNVFVEADEVFALVKEGSAGRPHIAQAMVHRGYVRSVREAFDRYLRNGGPATAPRRKLTPEQAIEVIRKAGGVPVLAHPGLANRDAMIPSLVDAGLLGIGELLPRAFGRPDPDLSRSVRAARARRHRRLRLPWPDRGPRAVPRRPSGAGRGVGELARARGRRGRARRARTLTGVAVH